MTEPEAPLDARVARAIQRTHGDRIEREYVRSTIESPGWQVFYERTIAPTLAEWRRSLLSREEMTDGERRGLILARRTLLEGLLTCYKRTGAHIPEWFARDLEELG